MNVNNYIILAELPDFARNTHGRDKNYFKNRSVALRLRVICISYFLLLNFGQVCDCIYVHRK